MNTVNTLILLPQVPSTKICCCLAVLWFKLFGRDTKLMGLEK